MASCGAKFTLALDTEGSIWFMGAKGGMGIHTNDDDCQTLPNIFMSKEDYGSFSYICSGLSHSLAITDNGELYMFGENFARTKPDDPKFIPPKKVVVDDENFKTTLFATCGTAHSTIISQDRIPYTWGNLGQGRCGV